MSEVIFEITKEHLETGLRGIPVGYCTTSQADPQKGLFYKGQPIKDLAKKLPEEVIYLLLNGKLPNAEEAKAFQKELASRGRCSSAVIKHIQTLPRQGHPMKLFGCAMLMLGMLEGKNDYKEDAINLIAKVPHLLAAVINYHAGWGETPMPDESLDYMANFTHMLNIPDADKTLLTEVFRLFNILHYDHGGGNLSVFVAKAVASGHEDLYGAMTAALCALEGPLHGKANQEALELTKEVAKEFEGHITADLVEGFVRERLQSGGKIFGHGHAVLRVEDPRATICFDFINEKLGTNPLVETTLFLRDRGTKVLSENPKISNPYCNVDAATGTMLCTAGFDYPEYFTALFGLSRAVGVSSQIIYERCIARGGKGTPIVRPKYFYKPS